MGATSGSRWDFEIRLLAWMAVCVSVFSFLYYFRRGDLLLYGDAVAHINIARRVFDSKTPGLLQLGTVWLPLPHLVMMPFLISNRMWQSGVGGSIPSMVAYVFGVIGMFRLVRGVLRGPGERIAAWIAAMVYGANPNVIYLQTTAMGEALYLAFFIWTLVYFSEFLQGDAKAVTKCGMCLTAACLTRYDGWFLALVLVIAVAWSSFRRKTNTVAPRGGAGAPQDSRGRLSPHVALLGKFVLLAVAGPCLWLAYNAAVYKNPLEFANGPYSPRAIEEQTRTVNPAKGSLYAAAMYFLKAAELNVADSAWLSRLWLLFVVGEIGAVVWTVYRRDTGEGSPFGAGHWSLLLLGVPLPFYALSIAYGSVPLFVPPWWPFTLYNLRYGLQLLPMFAAAMGVLAFLIFRLLRGKPRIAAGVAVIAVVVVSYATVWQANPICRDEAAVNARARMALESQLARWLQDLPANSTLLMYLGEHPGAVEQAGLPLSRVINEGNHRVWKHPVDPEGLWERALANPADLVDYVVAFEGDSVWRAVQARHLQELVEIRVSGQSRAVLYRAR